MKKKKNDIKLLPSILKKVNSEKTKKIVYSKKRSDNGNFAKIKNINDFLQYITLQEGFKSIMGYGYDLKENHIYTKETEEINYEIIKVLERLEIAYVEWDRFRKQKHREIGNRLITFSFYGDKVIEILNRINGENSIISRRALRVISQHAKDMELGYYLIEFLLSIGVPESLIDYSISGDDAEVVYRVMLYFSSSNKKSDHKILFQIIEKLSSPYVCGGDEKALEIQNKFKVLLRHDGYYFKDGKIMKITNDLLEEIEKERIKRMESLRRVTNEDKKVDLKIGKFPEKLKAGTQWKHITIVFIDERNVAIHVSGLKEHLTDFEEMGFMKGKKLIKPNEAWNFLEILAKHNGEIFPSDPDAKRTFKKQKEFLTKALQTYFRKEEDPFFPYKSSPEKRHESYRARFGLFYQEKKKHNPLSDLASFKDSQISRG